MVHAANARTRELLLLTVLPWLALPRGVPHFEVLPSGSRFLLLLLYVSIFPLSLPGLLQKVPS